MTQLVLASTLFAAAGAAAAVDAGLLGRPQERVLLVSNAAPVPELAPALDEIPGCGPVLARFDRVVHLADLLGGLHPHVWSPRDTDLPVLERLLRTVWGLGEGPVELVVESPTVNPAAWLARVLRSAPLTVHSDGLMAYGPWRREPALHARQRLRALVHLDLVPGLQPVTTRELGFEARAVPAEPFLGLLDEMAQEARPRWWPDDEVPTALLVGQYLAALELLSAAEEAELHARMVRRAAAAGARRVVLKPHPSAPPGLLAPVRAAADREGIELVVVDDPLPAEVALVAHPPALVVGCFSTATATARTLLGLPTEAVGTELLLQRLEAGNSNRVPVAIVHAWARGLAGDRLQEVVDAVAYGMQPRRLAAWRERAVRTLTSVPDDERGLYVPRERLTELALPGARGRPPHERRRWRRAARRALLSVVQPLVRGAVTRWRGSGHAARVAALARGAS
ncbi:polysialyltransferase family glycosyltransferase [Cellulomonas massiliensis]|uniref:polysialyltransferase family glycosyltransferase n=1 Tax=Cellulomonas massiliensis TaxID=1465811 RepID=UPI0002F364B7|nr:polysialyltransferase family glycosyltransferase [Cellulomonas massiliensis]